MDSKEKEIHGSADNEEVKPTSISKKKKEQYRPHTGKKTVFKYKNRECRPYIITEELIKEICERIEAGEMATVMCLNEDHMPTYGSLFRWMQKSKENAQRIALSREIGYDLMAEEMKVLSREFELGFTKKTTTHPDGRVTVELVEYDNLPSKKLQLETTKHLLGIWNRSKFGTKVDGTVSGSFVLKNDLSHED
jgi:hypothetical protein